MKIHEYQAKELFKRYNIPVPAGGIAFNGQEAKSIVEQLGGFPVVVKAQIHAGGRGKGGGVKLARSMEEVTELAEHIIGMTLVTHQTGPEGRLVKKVLIEQGLDIEKELYLSIFPTEPPQKLSLWPVKPVAWILKRLPKKHRKKLSKCTSVRLPAFRPIIPGRLLLA